MWCSRFSLHLSGSQLTPRQPSRPTLRPSPPPPFVHAARTRRLPQSGREAARRHAIRFRLIGGRLLVAAADAVRRRGARIGRCLAVGHAVQVRHRGAAAGAAAAAASRRLLALLHQHIRIGGVHAEVEIGRVLLVVLRPRSGRLLVGGAEDVRVAAARRLQHAAGVLRAAQANVEFGGAHGGVSGFGLSDR